VSALQRDFRGTLVATVLEDAVSLWSAPLPPTPIAWLGSEGQGLSAAAAAVAHLRLRIPLAAGVESLNVASAAAFACSSGSGGALPDGVAAAGGRRGPAATS
jgi:tRNA G18 (ribose-2'-O)-methylase SpoU